MYILLNDKKVYIHDAVVDPNVLTLYIASNMEMTELYNLFKTCDLENIKMHNDDDSLNAVYDGYVSIDSFFFKPMDNLYVINLKKYSASNLKDSVDNCVAKVDKLTEEVVMLTNGDLMRQSNYALMTIASTFSDEQAVKCILLFEEWIPDIDYVTGDRRRYNNNLYKCKQNHTSEAQHTPDLIPALWDLINPDSAKGTIDNPIPIPEPFTSMVYVNGKYYIEDGVIYLMNRVGMTDGEEISLTFKPSALIGQYFEVANKQ